MLYNKASDSEKVKLFYVKSKIFILIIYKKQEVLKEILFSVISKASQITDIPTKFLKKL